jgi:hypothetical protein
MKARILQSYVNHTEKYEEIYDEITQGTLNEYEVMFANYSVNPTEDDINKIRDIINDGQKPRSDEEVKQITEQTWGVSWVMASLAIRNDRMSKKQGTINRWIRDAKKKDEKILSVKPNDNLSCSNCLNLLKYKWSILYDFSEGKPSQVLLFYQCNKCSKREAFFEDCTKWVDTNTNNCLICQGKRNATITKDAEGKIFSIYECIKCGSKQVESL